MVEIDPIIKSCIVVNSFVSNHGQFFFTLSATVRFEANFYFYFYFVGPVHRTLRLFIVCLVFDGTHAHTDDQSLVFFKAVILYAEDQAEKMSIHIPYIANHAELDIAVHAPC